MFGKKGDRVNLENVPLNLSFELGDHGHADKENARHHTPSGKGRPHAHKPGMFLSPLNCLKPRALACCNGQAVSPNLHKMIYHNPMATPEDWKLRRAVRKEIRRQVASQLHHAACSLFRPVTSSILKA